MVVLEVDMRWERYKSWRGRDNVENHSSTPAPLIQQERIRKDQNQHSEASRWVLRVRIERSCWY